MSPPLYGVKRMSIMLFTPLVDVVRFVEGLLWISPHLKTLVFKYNDKHLKASLEVLYLNYDHLELLIREWLKLFNVREWLKLFNVIYCIAVPL